MRCSGCCVHLSRYAMLRHCLRLRASLPCQTVMLVHQRWISGFCWTTSVQCGSTIIVLNCLYSTF
uniref:Uncharacterized protein n=1 Tax=Arundo donax TaxID=35708 RepID=A0A0A9B189_ARUDO